MMIMMTILVTKRPPFLNLVWLQLCRLQTSSPESWLSHRQIIIHFRRTAGDALSAMYITFSYNNLLLLCMLECHRSNYSTYAQGVLCISVFRVSFKKKTKSEHAHKRGLPRDKNK